MSAQSASSTAMVRPWFGVALAGAATLTALGPSARALSAARHGARTAIVPGLLCAVHDPDAVTPRPGSVVTVLRSDVLDGSPGKRVTTLLVHYAPRALTPKHVHGGPVTAYVLSGRVRSQLGGGPAGTYGPGETFYEPVGTVHTFIENPSASGSAELLATIVHDEGAPLTTLVE